MTLLSDSLIEDSEPKPRRKVLEPKNHYDYCQAIANSIKMPLWWVQKRAVGWEVPRNFEDLRSQARAVEETRGTTAKIKFIKWFLNESMPKEI